MFFQTWKENYYKIRDLYANGILDLGQLSQRPEMQGGIHKISQLKVAPWENIIEHVSIDNLKQMGNKTLKSLRVALLNPVTLKEMKIWWQSEVLRGRSHFLVVNLDDSDWSWLRGFRRA